jgi:hypothetical protein
LSGAPLARFVRLNVGRRCPADRGVRLRDLPDSRVLPSLLGDVMTRRWAQIQRYLWQIQRSRPLDLGALVFAYKEGFLFE